MTNPVPVQLNLGPALFPDAISGIYFHCILAWPTMEEGREFHRVAEEMIAGAMRMSLRENPDAVRELERKWPQQDWERYRTLARAKRRTSVGRLKNRLKQRMAAARMAIGYWSEEIPGFEVRLPPAMIRPSVDQLSKLIRSDIHIDDAHNIEKLVWRPSLPIIHLAMGTQLELCVRNPEARDNEIMTDDRDFVRSAVARASVFEPMVTHHPLLASGKIALTQVRWFE